MTDPRNPSQRERLIEYHTTQLRLSTFCGFLTSLSAVFMLSSLDDGGYLDMHKTIPAAIEERLKIDPNQDKAVLEAELTVFFNKGENGIRGTCAFFTGVSGLLLLYRKRKLDNLLNAPK